MTWTSIRRFRDVDFDAFPQFEPWPGQVPLISYYGTRHALIADKNGIHYLDGRSVQTHKLHAPRELMFTLMERLIKENPNGESFAFTPPCSQPETQHRSR